MAFGIELVHELEIYVEAGLTHGAGARDGDDRPGEAGAARTSTTGSIKVGKAADLVLVEGDPSKRIGDLRQTRVVMLDGKLLDADALRTAAGFRAGRSSASDAQTLEPPT